jgi:DDE superfamily endonuclease/Tc5 transposase DNA-binding domain/Fission yeast centromere protein N-terminal domain
MSEEGVKKQRNAITNAQKITLRSQHHSEPGMSYRELATWFEDKYDRKINLSSISRILSPHFAFLDNLQGQHPLNGKRHRPENWPELEQALSEWVRRAKNQNMILSQEILRQKAKQFWPDIYPGKEPPQLSNGWLERFQSRQDIKLRKQNTDAETSAEEAAAQMITVRQLLRAFAPRDIFNCDETGLFWNMTPDRSLTTRAGHDRQKEQARISALFCCNSDASERLPPLFIGTAKRPAAFSKAKVNIENLGCFWRSNKQAWMTSEIFKEWLIWFDAQMQDRKVVLLMDKFSAHEIAVQKVGSKLQNTLVVWLPGSSTSRYHPLDQGIIYTWKAYWKREWLRYMAMEFERAVHPSMTVTILMAIRWSITAWTVDIEDNTIANCFKMTLELETDATIDTFNLHREISTSLQNMKLRNWVHDIMDISQFLDSANEKVTDDVIDIDSLVLSQFISSEDADEDEGELIQDIPRVSTSEALQGLHILRLHEEQQANGNRELIQLLLRHERLLQSRVEQHYQNNKDSFLS